MTTKNDVIQEAYREIRISGLTVNPRPSDTALALVRLDNMMAEFFEAKNFNFGYNFEANPDPNSETGVRNSLEPFMRYQLALRLIPAFNKNVPQTLIQNANGSLSSAHAINSQMNVRPVQPPRRMPVGSGNRVRDLYSNRFQIPQAQAPYSASTNKIVVGETQDYEEDFTAWLQGNTVSTFSIDVDPRLTLDASSQADGFIDYTVTATDETAASPELQYLKITVTDSAGRVNIRLVNFEVTVYPEVP